MTASGVAAAGTFHFLAGFPQRAVPGDPAATILAAAGLLGTVVLIERFAPGVRLG